MVRVEDDYEALARREANKEREKSATHQLTVTPALSNH